MRARLPMLMKGNPTWPGVASGEVLRLLVLVDDGRLLFGRVLSAL